MPIRTKLVAVLWEDAAGVQRYWEQAVTTATVLSIGHLIRRNKKEVVLALSKSTDSDFGGSFAIPIGCVRKIRRIPWGKI